AAGQEFQRGRVRRLLGLDEHLTAPRGDDKNTDLSMGLSRAESSLLRSPCRRAASSGQYLVLPLCTRPFDAGRSLGLTIGTRAAPLARIVAAPGAFLAAGALVVRLGSAMQSIWALHPSL